MVDVVVGNLRFTSTFDSGNLGAVSTHPPQVGSSGEEGDSTHVPSDEPTEFFLTVAPDCQGTSNENNHRTWFYFSVTYLGRANKPSTDRLPALSQRPFYSARPTAQQLRDVFRCTFTIVNFSVGNRIFDHDNRFVFCTDKKPAWERHPQPLHVTVVDRQGSVITSKRQPPPLFRSTSTSGSGGTVRSLAGARMRASWEYTFSFEGERVFFALSYPYSYQHWLKTVDSWQAQYCEQSEASITSPTCNSCGASSAPVTPPRPPVASVKRSYSSDEALSHFPTPPPRSPSNVSSPYLPSRTQPAAAGREASALPPDIYFHRETLCFSLQDRRVDLVTITGKKGMSNEVEDFVSSTVPVRSSTIARPHKFPGKRIVLVTARVHPGETPGSHVLHGLIEFLLSDDPRSAALRERFVFNIVPILNPDGVVLGHYRTDSRGVNLNRTYDHPDVNLHPSIHATVELFKSLAASKRLVMYMDLHAHASKRGCFVFGNAWEDREQQLESLLLAKLLSLNSQHFDLSSCDFTSRSMEARSRNDGQSKEGTSRVCLARQASLPHSFTLEVSYNTGVSVNNIVALPCELHSAQARVAPAKYTPEVYHSLGVAIAASLLDYHQCNPMSRLPYTPYNTLNGVRHWLERQIRQLHTHQTQSEMESTYSTRQRTASKERAAVQQQLAASLSLPLLDDYGTPSKSVIRLAPACNEEQYGE